ncbi:hypothetical protein JCM10212_003619 [Sporobolomyces blumeae]
MSRPPPPDDHKPPSRPLVPLEIVDAPTQRLYLVAAFVLVQAYKLAHLVSPPPSPSPTALIDPNWTLYKWIAIDLIAVQVVHLLRVPRFDQGWKQRWAARVLLVALDYLLFGRWTFTASLFLPSSLKSLVTHYLSTAERSVRLSKVIGSQGSHLGGQYTVHILAVSTAILNPLSSTYCRFASTKSSEPTLIPLLLNNTTPSKLTYSLTSLYDPSSTREITIPAKDLVKAKKHHLPHHVPNHQGAGSDSNQDDDLALAAQWSLVPSRGQQAGLKNPLKPYSKLHHPLPRASSSSSRSSPGGSITISNPPSSNPDGSNSDLDDPFSSLSPSQSLYYLPITTPGFVQLVSIVDTDGHAIKIRRKRSTPSPANEALQGALSASTSRYEQTLIVECPRAGFDLDSSTSPSLEHRCLADGGASSFSDENSLDLGLTVQGQAPLTVKWYSRSGSGASTTIGVRRDKVETLEGIVSGSLASSTDEGDSRLRPAPIRVPLNITLSSAGRTTYYLDRVIDAYGNEVVYNTVPTGGNGESSKAKTADRKVVLEGMEASRSVLVHRPPSASFVGSCAKGDEDQLLHGKAKTLDVRIGGLESPDDGSDEGATVAVRFTPFEASGGNGWTKEVEAKGSRVEVGATEQGRYEIVDVKTRHCDGAVLVPNACSVVLQPLPTLSTTFTPLQDLCSAPTGLLTTLHLTGVAPFTVHYTLTRLSGSRPASTRHVHRLTHSRDELELKPGPGEYEVRFVRIEDKFYKGVDVRGGEYATRIKVEEVAEARWTEREKTVHSCEGGTVGVEVDLKGSAPWTLEYSVVGQKPRLVENIQKSPVHLDVEIPPVVSQLGGQFALSLESVVDSHGCRRPLTSPDLVVDVRRTKPTARFHGTEGKREIVIRDGDEARIPVRLTGEGPWTITYSAPTSSRAVTFKAHQPNVDLLIPSAPAGTYRLLSVRDKFCPGDVEEVEWKVSTLERPTVAIDDKAGKRKGGVLKRAGVCQNKVDSFDLVFNGKAPFKATYSLAKDGQASEARQHTLSAIQRRAALTLFTAEPGRHVYEVTGVSDSLYTSPSSHGVAAPNKVEHEVWPLPTAYFSAGPKHGFCVHDELASRSAEDLVLELSGQAPFVVELEVREEGKRGSKRFEVPDIKSHKWPVLLPYKLVSPSAHSVSVRRVVDAHGCESLFDASAPSVSTPSSSSSSHLVSSSAGSKRLSSVVIPVSETASISPVSPQIDHCVGDFLDFAIQGSPPFTVKYEFEGKQHSVPVKGNKFQRVATEQGLFKVLSVGHGEDQCRSNSVEFIKRIHPIPSAKVSTGESIVVDIREGDQTEIVFEFAGTPPFSFTYSRRAPQDRSKDRKVLETHTVTGIEESSYSILTSQEGTYSVSHIADRYCSYPPRAQAASPNRS